MWSGPRNISTAMLRSWGARSDTFVTDEPLYSHYLDETKLDHPGADEVITAHDRDWQRVTAWLTGEIPQQKTIWYQKHMAHHLLDDVGRDWIMQLTNAFLIRDPAPMVVSLSKVLPNPTLPETGLPQQVELFDRLTSANGNIPPVVLAKDVLRNPAGMLHALCNSLGVPYSDEMLSWQPGRRETDGVWAKHWYANVEASTGFEPYAEKHVDVPERLVPLVRECDRLFEHLYNHKIEPLT
ncbi:MAG: HAD family hydrolase [Phycisphaeraceae bacterium]|nr:HAD family hydrolase [Phycisphaeraceae bacterium]